MAGEWTEAQVQQLCNLVHEIPATVSDVERWKIVSKRLGMHSKGECYRKYQELLRSANEPPQTTADAEAKPEAQHSAGRKAETRVPLPPSPSCGLPVAAEAVRSRAPTPAESAFLASMLSDGTRALPKSWTQQGICFRRDRGFGWAVRQWEGGPCGPLAVIQAFLVRSLQRACGARWREPSDEEKAHCVSLVLADILLRCQEQEEGTATVKICAVPERGMILGDNLSARQLFHSMTVREIPVRLGRPFLINQLAQQYRQYTADRGPGLLLFLSSVLLSKGGDAVKADMVLSEHMIDRYGYASQELVNLLISGQATPCVFDETPESAADAIVTEQGRLCGIRSRCEVGFLTCLEFFDHVAVGEHLKRPTADVWVICMESHYTIAFVEAIRHENLVATTSCDTVDVMYYDQLEKGAELIVLTLAKSDDQRRRLDPAQAPPLELVLHTRWPGYSVDWNGTEPLL